MKKSQNPRFEVDFKARLKQSQEASNAVRMPRLGYSLYRVYDIEKPKGVSKGILNGVYGSVGTGKSSYTITISKSRQYNKANWQQTMWAFFDDLAPLFDPVYNLVWLKPKHVTLLRMKGHRVEPAQPGDKSMTIQGKSGPVSIGA
jgi:hypothetical protein